MFVVFQHPDRYHSKELGLKQKTQIFICCRAVASELPAVEVLRRSDAAHQEVWLVYSLCTIQLDVSVLQGLESKRVQVANRSDGKVIAGGKEAGRSFGDPNCD